MMRKTGAMLFLAICCLSRILWGADNIDRILKEFGSGNRVMMISGASGIPLEPNKSIEENRELFIKYIQLQKSNLPFNAVLSSAIYYQLDEEDWNLKEKFFKVYLEELHKRGIACILYFNIRDVVSYTVREFGPWKKDEMRVTSKGEGKEVICFNSPGIRERAKFIISRAFSFLDLDGLYFEEPGYFGGGFCYCENCEKEFRKFLLDRYGSEEKINGYFGIKLEEIKPVKEEERFTKRKLWYEWFRFCQYSLEDFLASVSVEAKRIAKENHGKDIITMATVGYDGVLHPYAGARQTEFLRREEMTGMCNALYWQDFDYSGSVQSLSFKNYHQRVKFCKSQTGGKPVWFWIIAKNEPSWIYETEVYDSLLAGIDGFIPYALAPEVTDGYKKSAEFIMDNQSVIAGAASESEVAILNSYEQTNYRDYGCNESYTYIGKHISPLFYSLSDIHIPVDYVTQPTERELNGYKVLMMDEIRNMPEEEIDLIRKWVSGGGKLIAFGDTGSHDIYEEPFTENPLKEVLGVENIAVKTARTNHIKTGGAAIKYGKFLSTGYGALKKMTYCRDGYGFTPLPGSETVASWEDDTPAIIKHGYGKGEVVYSGAFFQFLSGEGADRLIKYIMEKLLGGLPVYTDLPSSVDVNVMRKSDKLFIYLANLPEIKLKDETAKPLLSNISSIDMAVPLTNIKLKCKLPLKFSPEKSYMISPDRETKTEIPFAVKDSKYIEMNIDSLKMFDIVIIEGGKI